MNRKLIVFGNGLGRALDNDYFQLQAAMTSVWGSDLFDENEKEIIASLKGFDAAIGPTSEADLRSAYTALIGHSMLKLSIEPETLSHWLNTNAAQFPSLLEKYIYAVAHYFHEFQFDPPQEALWRTFTQPLIDYIFKSRSHVATLNYDTLLYAPFNRQNVTGKAFPLCRAKVDETSLGDGFQTSYTPKTFNWYNSKNPRGTYLHLHGTPLFYKKDDGVSAKRTRDNLPIPKNAEGKNQIILGPTGLKLQLIESCDVLKDYWEVRLPKCIREADEIILFGYGGADSHLNDLLKKRSPETNIHIVERNQEGTWLERKKFWSDNLSGTVSPILLDDILDFTDWDDPSKQPSIPYSEIPF
ncbi:hypothetical protein EDD53_0428 [Pacificibacter maritimus]|uniref:SIR2-like protein n=1 Tax=Pacificibacter maritimus TaxID=762213 RepID=A0A3N4UL37_9RHOB|nr:hypothetical protein [Pacificibacter maritimus]RPE71312.1 hypothetical protein EDD53_0428 [Pacificibacter maritimus]